MAARGDPVPSEAGSERSGSESVGSARGDKGSEADNAQLRARGRLTPLALPATGGLVVTDAPNVPDTNTDKRSPGKPTAWANNGARDDAGTGAGAGAGAGGGAAIKLDVPMLQARAESDIIRLRNVHKTYMLGVEGVPALRGVSITVKRGEFVVILGKSGSGKTTMLNVIGTIDVPTRGDIFLCGHHITQATKDIELAQARLLDLGFVFQTFNLLPSMTAAENVEMPMVLAGVPSGVRARRARELLRHVGMGHRCDHTPSQLSGGEQQRVTIARALANAPKVLLLDEPTGDLDTVNSNMVMRIITDLNEHEQTTMVMVTHDVALRAFAHRVIHMLDGKVQRVETVPASVRARALRELRAVTVETTVNDVDDGSSTPVPVSAVSQREVLEKAKTFTSVRKPGFYSKLTATPL